MLSIREYEDGDLDAVVDLWTRCDLTRPWNDPARDLALAGTTPNAQVFVGCEPEERGVATVMTGSDGHRGWLYYLAVEPALRRGGYGRDMVAHAEAWLADLGVPKVELMIRPENELVRDFYRRIGYEVEPRIIMSRRIEGE